jgi:LPXTG-motif cell wall-anchored protein
VGLKNDDTVVATGWEAELDKWNLGIVVPPMNWPLIGGIIAAVVAVGLFIFFVRRRRAA